MNSEASMPTASIGRDDILNAYPAARRSGQLLEAAVLDVAFDVFLAEMHSSGLFDACGIVFKGGTALRKFHFGHKSRWSFDLDFDAEEGAGEFFADEMSGCSSLGFEFEVVERRGHLNLRVASALFPADTFNVKVDFSSRGCWLPPDYLHPLSSPALPDGAWAAATAVPTMKLVENVAEKISRWQSKRLVRDLYDIASAYPMIDDMGLVAEMYVLKSHQNLSSQLPSRRPPRTAARLTDVAAATAAIDLDLADLVHPSLQSDAEKTARIQADLAVMGTVAAAIDQSIEGSPLEELANDNGKLNWKASGQIEELKKRHSAEGPSAEPQDAASNSAVPGPSAQESQSAKL